MFENHLTIKHSDLKIEGELQISSQIFPRRVNGIESGKVISFSAKNSKSKEGCSSLGGC